MKIKLLILLGLFGLFSALDAQAAPSTTYANTLLPINNTRDIGSTLYPWRVGYFTSLVSPSITLNGDTRTSWPGSSGANDWGTFGSYFGNALTTSSTIPVHILSTLSASGTIYATTFNGAGTGITGLGVSNFTSQNISQWTNDANFITNYFPTFSVATSSGFGAGKFYVDTSGNIYASGTIYGTVNGYLPLAGGTMTGSITGPGIIIGSSTLGTTYTTSTAFMERKIRVTTASTSWTSTNTIYAGPAYYGMTFVGAKCETDAGTVNVSLYDGTDRANIINASTTIGNFVFSTNNTFTASESIRIDMGTPATSPTKCSCVLLYKGN